MRAMTALCVRGGQESESHNRNKVENCNISRGRNGLLSVPIDKIERKQMSSVSLRRRGR